MIDKEIEMTDFNKLYNEKKSIIEEYIERDLELEDTSYKKVADAMRYSVEAGGKRIRPVLLLAVYSMFKDDYKSVLPFCAAIEYIHTYSLIHDDLPAMDNDNLRRGKLTCHKVYGEAMAILAGDALLNFAFEKMLCCNIPNGIEAAKVIAEAAGKNGMIGGQVIDIENEGEKISLKLLNELHALKTGALIRCSCVAGAILGGASEKDAELLGEFGSLIGMAFQIKDDLLDKLSDTKTLGKEIGSDEKNKKTTYLSYFSVTECEAFIDELTTRAEEILDNYGEKALFLKDLAMYLLKRKM